MIVHYINEIKTLMKSNIKKFSYLKENIMNARSV